MIDLTDARANAESTMTATATVTRSGVSTFDPATGTTAPVVSTVWTGPCSIHPVSVPGHGDAQEGGGPVGLDDYRVRVPFDVTGPQAGDAFTIGDAGGYASAGLTGRVFTIVAVTDRTVAVMRTLTVTARVPAGRV